MEDDLLEQAERDLRTMEFIKNYLPQEVKGKFTDDDIYYFIDLIAEEYLESGILDAEPDADGYVNIDTMAVAKAIAERARKENFGNFDADDLLWVVQGELEAAEDDPEA